MGSLFCNLCLSQPSDIVDYYFTKCLHLFCKTCLNTKLNKGDPEKVIEETCIYCGSSEIFYHKIDKPMKGEEITQIHFPNTVLHEDLKVKTLLIATELQENQLKSMIKLSHEYDDTLIGVKNKYLKSVKEIKSFKKICSNKINYTKQIAKEIKIYIKENNDFAATLTKKDKFKERANEPSSGSQLLMLFSKGYDENKSLLLSEDQISFNTTNFSEWLDTKKRDSESFNITRQEHTLSKSFFDQTSGSFNNTYI